MGQAGRRTGTLGVGGGSGLTCPLADSALGPSAAAGLGLPSRMAVLRATAHVKVCSLEAEIAATWACTLLQLHIF